jgi:hypothetical protein
MTDQVPDQVPAGTSTANPQTPTTSTSPATRPAPPSAGTAIGAAFLIAGSLGVFFSCMWLIFNHLPTENTLALPLLVVGAFAGIFAAIGVIAVAFQWSNLGNPQEALGLPAGSVRALIALLVIVMFAVLSFYLVETLKDLQVSTESPATDTTATSTAATATAASQTATTATGSNSSKPSTTKSNATSANAAVDISKQILTILSTLMTAISGFYFGSKSASDAAKTGGDTALKGAALTAGKQ